MSQFIQQRRLERCFCRLEPKSGGDGVPITESEEEYTGLWCSAMMTCDYCGHEWAAVWRVIAIQLECPECSIYNSLGNRIPDGQTKQAN